MTDAPHPERRNFYGRTHGKTLRASQKDYLAEDLGPLTLRGVTREENPDRKVLDLSIVRGQLAADHADALSPLVARVDEALRMTDETVLKGINSLPLFAGFAGVGLLLLAFSAMWYREGR